MGRARSTPARVLIVARRTAESPELMAAVSDRVARGPCTFTLLLPSVPGTTHRLSDGGEAAAHARLDAALPRLCVATGQDVQGIVGVPDPLVAVRDALNLLGFDEVIISLLPPPLSGWLRMDLPRRVHALGIPVTTVISMSQLAGRRPALA